MIHKILSIVALMLLLASCVNDIDNSSRLQMRAGADNKLPVFYATIEGSEDAATKVYADDLLRVLWNADDRITVFNKYSYGYEYCFSGEDGDNAGEFAAVPNNNIVTGNPLDHVYALYPHNSFTKISNDGVITATLPANQTYKANSFGIGANTMVSVTDDTQLRFKNVGGYLSFKFYGDNVSVKSITLKGNNGEKLAGNASITMAVGGTPTVEMQEDATESITLTCETPVIVGATAQNPTEFWFVIPPTTFSQGFTVKVIDPNGKVFEKSSTSKVEIGRNHLSRMSPMEVEFSWWDDNTVPPDNEIWYITTNGLITNPNFENTNGQPFNCSIVSNTYEHGRGVIRLDAALTDLKDYAFAYNEYLCELYLPDCVKSLGRYSLLCEHLTHFRVPNCFSANRGLIFLSTNLERFYGPNTTPDGRSLILDGVLVAVAGKGLTNYTIPDNVQIIGEGAFRGCIELESVSIPESVSMIRDYSFYQCVSLHSVTFPESLTRLGSEVFRDCYSLESFYGNPQFISSDNKLAIMHTSNGITILAATADLIDYTIPEGMNFIQEFAFSNSINLKRLSFPSTLSYVSGLAFEGCNELEGIYGFHTSEDHKGLVFDTKYDKLLIKKGVRNVVVQDGITEIGYMAFYESPDLEEVYLPDSVVEVGGYAFDGCFNLKKVILSSNLNRISNYNPFFRSTNLQEIYFRSFFPPQYSDTQFFAFNNLTVFVPEETLVLYQNSGWYQFAPYMVGYHYDDIGEWDPDFYISTDYSDDGQITTLQTATVGAGIDLILMGDAFSDRQIADGTYGSVMQKAMNAFFSEEPYKTRKNCFNVYQVNVVSATEGYEHSGQALGTGRGDGTYCYGNDTKVIEYARAVVGDARMDDALVIVMMNEDAYAGTCFMYYPDSGDYGRGLSIAYFPTSSDTDTFNGLVSHEAGGHGFAKLADEYAYEYMGTISANDIANRKAMEPYGWWKNVDFTSDPTQVKWSRFIADVRYDGQGLGCFEGGLTYWSGVWRPTESSIMRYNTGGFNAPSREAIWYRIHKLAYGENWQYNYEDFVAYDAINRTVVNQAPKPDYVARQLPKPTPPVVVGHSWREALER